MDDLEIRGNRIFVPGRSMPHHGLTGVQHDVTANARAFNFHFATLDALRPFVFSGVKTRGGQVREHGFAGPIRADLFAIGPPAIQGHGGNNSATARPAFVKAHADQMAHFAAAD